MPSWCPDLVNKLISISIPFPSDSLIRKIHGNIILNEINNSMYYICFMLQCYSMILRTSTKASNIDFCYKPYP